MNPATSRLPRKSIIVLVILAGALTWVTVRQHSLSLATRHLAEAQRQNDELQQRLAAAAAARDSARQALRDQRQTAQQKLAAVANAEQELARVDPEARWATPPANGPEWDESSPYVWLTKSMLANLPGSPFTDKAELRDDVAATLALDPAAARQLNQQLAGILSEYRGLEVAHAERLSDPLPGIGDDGPQVTLRVTPFPEEGARLRRQFEETVRSALGLQRAELVIQGATGWLESQFALAGAEPKTISVGRHPDGTYNLSIRTGNSWFSTGGFKQLSDYVPDYLLPLFSDGLDQSPGMQGADVNGLSQQSN